MTEKSDPHPNQDREDRIDAAFGEYLEALDAGQPMDKAEFLAKYVDWNMPEEFGYYRVKKLLGQGAMGAVYLAHDTQLDRPVALKIPKFDQQNEPALVERFYREARAVATIHHPNICPVYDVGEIEGQVFLSMAFIKGRPLSDFTKSDKQQSQRSVAQLIMKIAMALQVTHEIGVVHRDLKPANIMVNQKGEPVVMDFGLARRLDSQEARVTQSGYIVGTPAYMSPEQVSGDPDGVGPKSDQYSLGVVFYELLTGQTPFSGGMFSIIGRIAHKEPTPLQELWSNVDPRLADICNKMMAKDPAHRFEDLDAVASALSTFLAESKTEAAPNNQSLGDFENTNSATVPLQQLPHKNPNPSRKKSSISPRLLLEGGMCLMAILAGVMVYFRNDQGTVRIEITDPKIRVTFADQTFTIDDNGSEIEVTPGKLNLYVEMDGELAVLSDGEKIGGQRGSQPVTPAPWSGNGLGMVFCWCPPGEFLMGSPKNEPDRRRNEDQVRVTLTQGFWLGKYELTQAEYKQLMGNNPSSFTKGGRNEHDVKGLDTTHYPVENVSWKDAMAFCRKLTEQEHQAGRLPAGWRYTLPTEAQWEYACRAGTTTATAFGDTLASTQANFGGDDPYNGGSKGPDLRRTTKVGSYSGNAWGLCDLHGNVWEWCRDWYGEKLPGRTDPEVTTMSKYRVARGGGWSNIGSGCRSALRTGLAALVGAPYRGFRVALVLSGE